MTSDDANKLGYLLIWVERNKKLTGEIALIPPSGDKGATIHPSVDAALQYLDELEK